MKRMFGLLIILFLIYFAAQYIFSLFGYSFDINYEIIKDEKKYEIHEKLSANVKGEENNYYYEIKYNDIVFNIQSYNLLNRKEKTVTNIKSIVSNGYTCIYPIFNDDVIQTDALCQKDNITYNYQTLKGTVPEIDNFFDSIPEYQKDMFTENLENPENKNGITTYQNNMLDKYYIAQDFYKGINTIGKDVPSKMYTVTLFDKDVYTRKLSIIANNLYVTADYNKEYEFDTFHVVDIITGTKKTIKSQTPISFDSFFQGSIGNAVYLIDIDKKVQYEIDVKNRTINKIGSENTSAYDYSEGKLVEVNISEIIKNQKTFNIYNTNDAEIKGYDKIDKVGKEISGYYYFYKKNGNKYDVYRSNVQSKDKLLYLFSVTNPESVKYAYNTIYYIDNNTVKAYNDKTGVRSIFKSSEYEFNNSLFYDVYYDK